MKVLLAIDSSKASQTVVSEAEQRPWPAGTKFCVIHVVDLWSFARVPAVIEDAKQAAQTMVKAAAAKLVHVGHDTNSDVLLGFPRKTVSEYAKDWGADLIMVGSHGQGALSRFLIGSVAQAVLRTAPCSVEIVRLSVDRTLPSSHGMKVLLATDGSEASAETSRSVAKRPWPSGSQFKIVSVVQLLIPENQMSASALSSVYPASLLEELLDDARSRAHDAVADARKALANAGISVLHIEATPTGDPRVVLLDHASAWGADLIVMGSHGWRGVDSMLMGSVSESVALHAHCSVEVIRG